MVWLVYHRISLLYSTLIFGCYLLFFTNLAPLSLFNIDLIWAIFGVLVFILNVKPFRRRILTSAFFKKFKSSLPALSPTEKEALAAGTVGWDGDLFLGRPNWNKLLSYAPPKMREEELQFLNGPVNELCQMIDNWEITHINFNLSEEIWTFLKNNLFFGIIIPKRYGGKGFSAYAHSAILTKIAGKSMSVASVVAVPSSLGPAELLLNYGTPAQQDYYLPRLAIGKEIPCFALTGPEAGSDAGSMPDYGIICHDIFENKKILGIRLNWNKRYITLAPVATVLGLAFKLYDPDHLIGGEQSLGITCALIPVKLPGISIGRRHYPLNSAFPNGPTQGKEVFIPIDYIIGGAKMAGQGWRMLVECLAAGRAISLPSMATGGAKISAFTTGAYARIRHQFHLPIGKFGGVEEALARIAGYTYIMEATRLLTISALDRKERPAVPAAISKYHVTELGRKVINDAMDIHGGKGICMGPKNYLAICYQETPISITVEGANILTRSMIIFGQGAIRCHPYILKEMRAVEHEDKKIGLIHFDQIIFSHLGFVFSNAIRSLLMGITRARWVKAPSKPLKRFYQIFTHLSSTFAFLSDITLMTLGGNLKRKEKLSGRLADVLSMLYLGSAVLKQFHDNGNNEAEKPVVEWACQYLASKAEQQLYDVLANFPHTPMNKLIKFLIFPFGRNYSKPSDHLGHTVANLMLQPNLLRTILAKDAYLSRAKDNPAGYIEEVLEKVIAIETLEKKLLALQQDKIQSYSDEQKIKEAVIQQILTPQEAAQLTRVYQLRKEILSVDDFSPEELEKNHDEKFYYPKSAETIQVQSHFHD